MEELVDDLIQGLEQIADVHEEIYDTIIGEGIMEIIETGFIDNVENEPFEVPENLGMFSIEGNIALRELLQNFLDQANDLAHEMDIRDPIDRREAIRSDAMMEFFGEDWWE